MPTQSLGLGFWWLVLPFPKRGRLCEGEQAGERECGRINTGFDTLDLGHLWDILAELREEIWTQRFVSKQVSVEGMSLNRSTRAE